MPTRGETSNSADPPALDRAQLASHATRGTLWRLLGQFGRMSLQLASLCYLSRILPPSDFGTVAFGLAIIGIGQLFVDSGPASAIVQSPVLTMPDLAWLCRLNLIIAFAISIVMAICATMIIEDREGSRITYLLAFGFFVTSFAMGPVAMLNRSLRFRFLAISDLLTFCLGNVIAATTLAHLGYGAISLAIGNVLYGTLRTCASFWASPISLSLRGERVTVDRRRIVDYGLAVSLAELVFYISSTLDIFLIGRELGSENLGYYSRAIYLIRTPANAILVSLHGVLFSLFSRITNDPIRICELYKRTVCLSLALLTPCTVFLMTFAAPLIRVLLGAGWSTSAVLFQTLSLLLLTGVSTIGDAVLKATSQLRLQLLCRITILSIACATIAISVRYGVLAVAYAVLATNCALALLTHGLACYVLRIDAATHYMIVRPALVLGTITCLGTAVTKELLDHYMALDITQIIVGCMVTVLATAVAAKLPFAPMKSLRSELLEIASHIISTIPAAAK